MNSWDLFNNTYQMLLCGCDNEPILHIITQKTAETMLKSMLKIFVGPVMGGFEPPPTPPKYATGDRRMMGENIIDPSL